MGRKAIDRLTQKKIGKTLRSERHAQDLSLETLADELDCSTEYLERVERGKNGLSLGLLVEWSRALGKELYRLLRDAEV